MASIQERIDALRKVMGSKGISAYIIPSSDPHQSEYVADHWKSREWISGFTGSAGTVVITMDHAGLFTDSRYYIQAETELSTSEFELHKAGQGGAEYFSWTLEQLSPGDKIAIDGQLFTANQVKRYKSRCKDKNISLAVDEDLIEEIWSDRPALPDNKIFLHDPKYSGLDRSEKFDQIREKMKGVGAEIYLMTALDDIAWAFNIRGRDVAYNPVAIAYAAIDMKKARLFIDPDKVPDDVRHQLKSTGVELHNYESFVSYIKSIEAPVYFDANRTNAFLAEQVNSDVATIHGDSFAMHLKALKNLTEQAWLRKAMVKDGVALTHAYKWLEDTVKERGIKETEVAEKLAYFRSQQEGYFGESFSAIIGYKGNGAIVHYRAMPETCKTIQNDGMLLTDSGGQYVDGTTDITRTFCFSEPSNDQKLHYTLVLKGHIGLARAVFPEGTTGAQLDIKAREHLWNKGLNYGHGTGHGVGFFMNVHEPPQGFVPNLSERGSTVHKAGHYSSNEPGYYVKDSHGIRIENLVICQPHKEFDGFFELETITLFPIATNIIDKSLMTHEEVNWLNDYHRRVYDALKEHLDEEHRSWLEEKCKAI